MAAAAAATAAAPSLSAHARFPIILVKYLVYNDAVITYAVNVIFTI